MAASACIIFGTGSLLAPAGTLLTTFIPEGNNMMILRNLSLMVLACGMAPVSAQQDIEGIWILNRIVSELPAPLNAQGASIQDAYDLLEDDPSLHCAPASIARVWGNPNTRTGIHLTDGRLVLEHELFDLRRSIAEASAVTAGADEPTTVNINGDAFTTMGHSVFHINDGKVLIETSHQSPGFIRTGTGYPQSDEAVTTETFWRDGEALMMELVYTDPKLFEGSYTMVHRLLATGENAVPEYNCTDADYDWFEQLNAAQSAAGEDN